MIFFFWKNSVDIWHRKLTLAVLLLSFCREDLGIFFQFWVKHLWTITLAGFSSIFFSGKTYLVSKEHLAYHHLVGKTFSVDAKNYNSPSKILDEYSEPARNKAMKTRASRVNAIFEFYSTRSIIFFQDKISVERVESSKMSTLVNTSTFMKHSNLKGNEVKLT